MQQVVLLGLGGAFLVKRTTQEIFVERSLITVWDEDGGIWWWKSGAMWEAWGTDGDEEHSSAYASQTHRFCLVATELISYSVLTGRTFM